MLTTPSGIVTFVSEVQPKKAELPMLATEQPPRDEGIVIAPAVVFGMPSIFAFPFDTEYVHVMPSTVSVADHAPNAAAAATASIISLFAISLFLSNRFPFILRLAFFRLYSVGEFAPKLLLVRQVESW